MPNPDFLSKNTLPWFLIDFSDKKEAKNVYDAMCQIVNTGKETKTNLYANSIALEVLMIKLLQLYTFPCQIDHDL